MSRAKELLFKTASVHEVQAWIDQGGDVNANIVNRNFRPLHYAARHNLLQIAKLLLESGADVNFHNRNVSTTLHWANRNGHCEMVQLLLEHGADPSIRSCRGGLSPMDAAETDAIRELLSKHAASKKEESNNIGNKEPTSLHDDEPMLKNRMKLAQAKHDYECTVAEMELEMKTMGTDATNVLLKRQTELKQLHAQLQEQQDKFEEQQTKLQAKMVLEAEHVKAQSTMLRAKTDKFKIETQKTIYELEAEVAAMSKTDHAPPSGSLVRAPTPVEESTGCPPSKATFDWDGDGDY